MATRSRIRSRAIAIHVGTRAAGRCRDAATRMSRLCARIGIRVQRRLLGAGATLDRVRAAIADAIKSLSADGVLVLTFSGDSERGSGWALHDGTLELDEAARLLSALPSSARAIVVADTCYGAALARHADVSCTLVLIAACGEHQTTRQLPVSPFVERLEDLVPGRCDTYAQLERDLRDGTPEAERPCVWTNRAVALAYRPFDLRSPDRNGPRARAATRCATGSYARRH